MTEPGFKKILTGWSNGAAINRMQFKRNKCYGKVEKKSIVHVLNMIVTNVKWNMGFFIDHNLPVSQYLGKKKRSNMGHCWQKHLDQRLTSLYFSWLWLITTKPKSWTFCWLANISHTSQEPFYIHLASPVLRLMPVQPWQWQPALCQFSQQCLWSAVAFAFFHVAVEA